MVLKTNYANTHNGGAKISPILEEGIMMIFEKPAFPSNDF